jgi:hypothetical protein
MPSPAAQPSLFTESVPPEAAHATAARVRMREMIERLRTASAPPWKDEMAAILDDGAFQRAMHYVPNEEARALWAEYDAHAERLYALLVLGVTDRTSELAAQRRLQRVWNRSSL